MTSKNTITIIIRIAFLAALCGFAGCTENLDGTRGPLSFRVAVDGPVPSKAEPSLFVDGTVNRTIAPGKSFGVYAWEGASASGRASFMENVRVTNEGGSAEGSFAYYPRKYWPADNRPVSMQAYYPYSDGTSGTTGITPLQTDGPASYSFTMNTDASLQTDFMVTDILEGLVQGGPSQPVHLTLRHVLAQIALDAQMPDGFTAESVEITGVGTQGVLTQSLSGGVTADTWTLAPSAQTITSSAGGREGTFLVIPQTVSSSQKIRLTWSSDEGGETATHTFEASLASAGIARWEAGQAYTYHLRLATSGLEVTVSVQDWQRTVKVMDYTTEITIRNDGRIRWTADTYKDKDDSAHTLQLGYRQQAVCTFTIDTPTGAIWKAVFRTDEGAIGAFEFVDGEGNGHSTISGNVGEPATLRIRATEDRPAQVNSAYLSIYVEAAGVNRHVTTLVDDLGSEWMIIQDRNV